MGNTSLKRFLILAIPAVVLMLLFNSPTSKADIGGQIPAPGLCEYPGVGGSGMIMSTYFYWCDFPTEINGSHWHCQEGGFAITAMGSVSIMMFTAGLSGQVGGIIGSCSWRCPDMSMAAQPNPPGAWKDSIITEKCKAVGPNPDEPQPEAAPAPPVMPTVTDPAAPNPLATSNSGQ